MDSDDDDVVAICIAISVFDQDKLVLFAMWHLVGNKQARVFSSLNC